MRWMISFSLLVLPVSGCIPISDFDPVGGAAAIAGSWQIDGAAPTAESCRAIVRPFVGAGVEPLVPRVRVTFMDQERAVPHSALIFNCVEDCGPDNPMCMSGGFDTLESRVVGAGDWVIRLEVIDAAGRVIATSEEQSVSAASGRIDLAPATFFSAIISADIAVAGAEPTVTSCTEAGIAIVRLVFTAAGGPRIGTGVERCAAGGVGVHVQPGTSYTVHLQAADETNQSVGDSPAETVMITPGQQYFLNTGAPIELTAL